MMMKKEIALLLALIFLIATILACSGTPHPQDNEFGIKAALKGLWKEAAFRWEKAIEKDPNNAKLHNNLAVAYENFGEYDKAFEHYKIALDLDASDYYIRNNAEEFRLFYQKLRAGEKKEEEKKEE